MTTGLHPLPSIHVAQVERIEHSYTVLETVVLPLNYTCLLLYVSLKWSRGWDLNPQFYNYKLYALPTELPRHIKEVTCVKAITTLLNCILLDSASSLCRLSHFKGAVGTPHITSTGI